MHAPGHDAAGRRSDPERWAILDAEAKAAKAKATGKPQVSGELGSFLSSLGIGAALGGPASTRNPFFGEPETDYPVRVRRYELFGGGLETATALQSQLLRDLYRMDPGSLATLQQRLLAGGFYSGDVDAEDLALGTPDEDTVKAYDRALQRAAAFNEADEDVTLDEVIDKAAAANAGKDKGKKRDPLVIAVTDPADIRQGVEAVARKALGRKLSDEEREKFVGLYQGIQAQTQRAAYAAQETGGTVTAAPNLSAFLAEKIRKEYGVEAGAHSLAETGNDFLDLLKEVGG